MWRNYLKTALRALWRRKGYTLINVFGLSVAMGCSIVGYLNYEFNTTWDAFHSNADRIYRIGSVRTIQDKAIRYGIVPSPADKILRTQVPGVKHVTVLDGTNAPLRIGDHLFTEVLWFASPDIFDMFSFPLVSGTTASFHNRSSVILSTEYANKYFGGENAVGKSVEIRIGGEDWQTFTVGGVTAEFPKNSSIQFDVLVNMDVLEAAKLRSPDNWKDWTGTVFIEVESPDVGEKAVSQLQTTVDVQRSANPDLGISGYYATPLRSVALESRDIRTNMLLQNPPISSFVGSLVSVIIILLLACFNYVNSSLATSASRLKEVGIRKVVGGNRRSIVTQFLGEQVLLCSISLLAGLGVAELLVRGWNYLWSWNPLSLNLSQNWPLLTFMIALVISIAVVAGFYPAWYISRFRPAIILKGQTVYARINGFMRGMLVLQFGLSLIAIIQAVSFAHNADFASHIDLGYAKDMRIFIPVEDAKLCQPLKNALLADANVAGVAIGADHIGFGARRREIKAEEKTAEATTYRVDARYPALMGLRLISGRLFDPDLKTDAEHSVLINQDLAASLDLKDPVGHVIDYDGGRYTVVGVVQDILNQGVWRPASPVLFKCIDETATTFPLNYVVIQSGLSDPGAMMDIVRSTWNRVAPDRPFLGYFQDRVVAEAVQVSHSITLMMIYMGGLAMIIAGLGLFALVSLKTVRRTKEIGVRKVLGATVGQIVGLINREFLILMVIALVIGDVLGYWMTASLLNAIYAYHSGVGADAIVAANVVSLVIAGVTAITLVYRAATADPVRSLRYE